MIHTVTQRRLAVQFDGTNTNEIMQTLGAEEHLIGSGWVNLSQDSGQLVLHKDDSASDDTVVNTGEWLLIPDMHALTPELFTALITVIG
jgi:hypothetical protein